MLGILSGKLDAVDKCDIYNGAGGEVGEIPPKFHGLAVKATAFFAVGAGSPLERDPAKVLDDVVDGFCAASDAADVYGVVLNFGAETVGLMATKKRRAGIKAR